MQRQRREENTNLFQLVNESEDYYRIPLKGTAATTTERKGKNNDVELINRKRKRKRMKDERMVANAKKSYAIVIFCVILYQLFCFAGKQISGNAQKLAVNELEQNLIDLNQTGLLNEARFEEMSKKIRKMRRSESRMPQFVEDFMNLDEKYEIRFRARDRTRRTCRRALKAVHKSGIENAKDFVKMPLIVYDAVLGAMRKTFVLRSLANGIDSFVSDVWGSIIMVRQSTLDRLLFEKMGADVIFENIKSRLGDNMDSVSVTQFGRNFARFLETLSNSRSSFYQFCIYEEAFEKVPKPKPPLEKTCAREKIALETAYQLSPFADQIPIIDRAFGDWTKECSSRCSEGFKARVNCNGDIELKRCLGVEKFGCDGVCGSRAEVDCSGACKGDSVVDMCGICGGSNRSVGCDGVCFSPVILDDYGTCCFAEDVDIDEAKTTTNKSKIALRKKCSRTHEEATIAKQEKLEEEEEERKLKKPNSFRELVSQFRDAKTKQRTAYINFFRLLAAIRIMCEIASKKVGRAIVKVLRAHLNVVLFFLDILFGTRTRSFVGLCVILTVVVVIVDRIFTLGVIEGLFLQSKTSKMLSKSAKVKTFADMKQLERKLSTFKKEAETTFEKVFQIFLQIFDVVLAKAIVFFWTAKKTLSDAFFDKRDDENGDKDDGISSPKTTKTKTNVHTRD